MPHLFLICSKQLYSLALFLIISHLSNFGSPGSQGMACPLGSRPIKRKRAWSGFIYCQGHSRRCCLTVAYIFTLIYILTWPCFSFFFPSPKNSVFYYPVPWQHPFFLLFSFFLPFCLFSVALSSFSGSKALLPHHFPHIIGLPESMHIYIYYFLQ